MDDAKWNRSISEAPDNESWKLVLPSTLDPDSSTASNQTFNHFEMIISCRRRTLLQFLRSDELNFYRPTVASVALRAYGGFFSKVCSGRNFRANDVSFNLFQAFQWSKHAPYYSSVMQTILHLINQTLYWLLKITESVTDQICTPLAWDRSQIIDLLLQQ